MVAAIVVSIIVMLIAVKPIGDFVNKYLSFKILVKLSCSRWCHISW